MIDPRADLYGDFCNITNIVKKSKFYERFVIFSLKWVFLTAVPHFFPSALDFGTGLVYN